MPELPEVEVTRLSFADNIAGARISSVFLGKPLRWPLGIDPDELVGRRVLAVRRRGKYLLLDLNQGLLLLHLGMSGSLRFGHKQAELGKHDHFEMKTTRGSLRLNDPRRFGAVVYSASEDAPVAQKLLGGLGVEPLESGFSAELLYRGLQKRSKSVKQVLLTGDIVVGVGNIYASEALFRAGIRPSKASNKLSKAAAQKLHAAIIEVLGIALQHGGSTLRNFSSAAGKTGYFQLQVMVYGREGEPCHNCQHKIKKTVQVQRSTFYCPACQK